MDFLEHLRLSRIEFRQGGRRGEITLCCVFCEDRGESEDIKFRLGINFITGRGQCFNCGWKSKTRAPEFLIKKIGREWDEDTTVPDLPEEKVAAPELPDDFELLWDATKNDMYAWDAKQYLLKRGVTKQTMKDKAIGFAYSGRYAMRIIFPVVYRKKLVGIVSRGYLKSQMRYMNSVGKKYLWNMPRRVERWLVLSEGIFKAITLERVTGHYSAAMLGHSVTPEMQEQLRRCGVVKICVWPDPDGPGLHGCKEVCDILSDKGYRVYTIWPPPKAQADEMDDDEVLAHWESKVRYSWGVGAKIDAKAAFEKSGERNAGRWSEHDASRSSQFRGTKSG